MNDKERIPPKNESNNTADRDTASQVNQTLGNINTRILGNYLDPFIAQISEDEGRELAQNLRQDGKPRAFNFLPRSPEWAININIEKDALPIKMCEFLSTSWMETVPQAVDRYVQEKHRNDNTTDCQSLSDKLMIQGLRMSLKKAIDQYPENIQSRFLIGKKEIGFSKGGQKIEGLAMQFLYGESLLEYAEKHVENFIPEDKTDLFTNIYMFSGVINSLSPGDCLHINDGTHGEVEIFSLGKTNNPDVFADDRYIPLTIVTQAEK